MFPFSIPWEHQKILGVEKGNFGSKWVKFLADFVPGLLVQKMCLKLKKCRQTNFQWLKICFQPFNSEWWNFINIFTRLEQKNLLSKTLCEP